MVIRFGLGMWICGIFSSLLAIFSGFNTWVAVVNGVVASCFIGIPMLVQTIWMGVARYSWYGKICADEQWKDEGDWMQNVFIAQCVMFYLFQCCSNAASLSIGSKFRTTS